MSSVFTEPWVPPAPRRRPTAGGRFGRLDLAVVMRQHERTLYLATQGTSARLEHQAVRVERPDTAAVRVPLRDLDSIVVYGHVNVTTDLIHGCSRQGTRVVYL